MAALLWGAWSPDWASGSKVDFDGINRIIYVHPEVTSLDIRVDVYSAWIDWVSLRDNSKFLPSIRYTGFDPIGGGNYTGDSYFLINGWKLSVDLTKVRVTGVLFSDNYDTAYYTTDLTPQYPATVAALVNTVSLPSTSTITPAELWAYENRSLSVTPPTAAEITTNVWGVAVESVTDKSTMGGYIAKVLLSIPKFIGLK